MKKFLLATFFAAIVSASAADAAPLRIYCGAGMTKPFSEISAAWGKISGEAPEVMYANAGQLQAQIKNSGEGDLFIAGAVEELKPVEQFVTAKQLLVKHIPVLAVRQGNPKKITSLADLARSDVNIVLGDPKATPIGKIADKALADAGIADKAHVVSRGMTAPSIFSALKSGECDAVIVWKENVSSGMEIVPDAAMDKYVKTIPAASLSLTKNKEEQKKFIDFLNSNEVKTIWKKFGYELAE